MNSPSVCPGKTDVACSVSVYEGKSIAFPPLEKKQAAARATLSNQMAVFMQ